MLVLTPKIKTKILYIYAGLWEYVRIHLCRLVGICLNC